MTDLADFTPYILRIPGIRDFVSIVVLSYYIFVEDKSITLNPIRVATNLDYNHTGVAEMLEECLLFYHSTVDLEQKLDLYWDDLRTEQIPKWNTLKSELVEFEEALDNQLIELQNDLDIAKHFSYLPTVNYEKFNRTVPEFINYSTNLTKKREAFWYSFWVSDKDGFTKLKKPLVYNNEMFNRTVDAIRTLQSRGIHIHPFRDAKIMPSLFNIQHLQELYTLFQELDRLEQEYNPSFMESTLQLFEALAFAGGLYFNEGERYQYNRLKYLEIPKFLKTHEEILQQFTHWVDSKNAQIFTKTPKIMNVVERIHEEFFEFVKRIEKEKLNKAEKLYQDLKKYPVWSPRPIVIPSYVNFISLHEL